MVIVGLRPDGFIIRAGVRKEVNVQLFRRPQMTSYGQEEGKICAPSLAAL